MSLAKRVGAEFVGTFWLVLGGCGSAVLAASFPTQPDAEPIGIEEEGVVAEQRIELRHDRVIFGNGLGLKLVQRTLDQCGIQLHRRDPLLVAEADGMNPRTCTVGVAGLPPARVVASSGRLPSLSST